MGILGERLLQPRPLCRRMAQIAITAIVVYIYIRCTHLCLFVMTIPAKGTKQVPLAYG